MQMPNKGEKGFTLIELLIVIAILGVLAAIVIPNVGRFIGSGETEAQKTELSTVQAAVQSMMVSNSLSSLSAYSYASTSGNATSDMTAFPGTNDAIQLYGGTGGSYLASNTTAYSYYVDASGSVYQVTD